MSILQPGTYKAKPEAVQFGIVETTGNEYIRVSFAIDFDDGSVETIGADLYFTEKTATRSIESLRYCGWKGTDLSTLDHGVDGMGSDVVELVLAMDTFTDKETGADKETLKVKWINRPGGRAVAKPMSDQQKATFAARMKGVVMAAGGPKPTNGATRPAASNARLQARPAAAPAGQWDGQGRAPDDDPIPFLATTPPRRGELPQSPRHPCTWRSRAATVRARTCARRRHPCLSL